MTVAAMVKKLADSPSEYEALRNAIWESVPSKDGRFPTPRSIGVKLRHLRKRVVGGCFLDSKDSNQGAVWSVKGVAKSDSRDSSDSNPSLRAHTHTHTHAREDSHGARNTVTTVTPDPSIVAPESEVSTWTE